MNPRQKGNYYRNKTKAFLEKDGWKVQNLEIPKRVFVKGQVFYTRQDLWGADLICVKNEELLIVQNKSNPVDISKGIKELKKAPWPDFVEKWVVIWPLRAREPQIIKI